MFGDGPLGREICGDEAGIRALPTDTIRDFWRTIYRPANTVIAVAGDIAHDELVELAAAAFGTGNGPIPAFAPAPALPAGPRAPARQARRRARPSWSSASRRSAATTPMRGPSRVLNAVLGDGMSSRLFLRVREERGLAYDVSSGLVDYADAGALEVSAGVDPAELAAALEAILAELARLRDELVPDGRAREGEALPGRRDGAADGRHAPRRVVDRRAGGAPRPRPRPRRGAGRGRARSTRRRRPAPGRRPVPGRRAAPGGGRRRPATCAASSAPAAAA